MQSINKYYLVGIKGTGMSSLAKLLKEEGTEEEREFRLSVLVIDGDGRRRRVEWALVIRITVSGKA